MYFENFKKLDFEPENEQFYSIQQTAISFH